MKPQDPAPEKSGAKAFENLVDESIRVCREQRHAAEHALNSGVDPESLIRYASGALSVSEREDVESLLSHSSWAMGRVIALVRSRRNPASLGAKILAATHPNPYAWGMRETGDRDMDWACLLEQVG